MKATTTLTHEEYSDRIHVMNMIKVLLRLGVLKHVHIKKFSLYTGSRVDVEITY